MFPCEGLKIDWTAFAALTALFFWLIDKYLRFRERKASARLLAQLMTTYISKAQTRIAKFKNSIISGENNPYLTKTLESQEYRKNLASAADLINIDLPSQFLDKADLFSELISNRLAWAVSELSRLKEAAHLLADLPGSTSMKNIEDHLMFVLKQTQDTTKAIDEASQALLIAAKSSDYWLRSRTKTANSPK